MQSKRKKQPHRSFSKPIMTPIMSAIAAIFIIFLAAQAQVFSAPTPCPMQETLKVEEATDSSYECRYSYLNKETLKDDIKTACRFIVGNCSIIHDKIFGRGSLVGHFCIFTIFQKYSCMIHRLHAPFIHPYPLV